MSLHAATQGHGSDIVLLHGWGLNGAVFDELAAALALAARVTVIELPGHGRSPWHPVHATLDGMTGAVLAAAPARAAWVGWSLGGLIAQHAARCAPGRVARLALLASTPRFTRAPDWPHAQEHAVQQQFAAALANDWRATLLRFLALEAQGSDHAREELRVLRERVFARGAPEPAALAAGLELLRSTDLRRAFAHLDLPLLALLGERDALVPAAVVPDLLHLNPAVQVQVLRGAAHAPFVAHLHDLLSALRPFLEAV